MSKDQQSDLEPVAAYDRVAAYFDAIRNNRQRYCDAIDAIILANLPHQARSMLDVGCGEGHRAESLASRALVQELVLVEPSVGMRKLMRTEREVWPVRIEDVSGTDRRFDVITCLWNVLGHVSSPEKRLNALRNMRALLSPGGALFLDVQNRYNARHYGRIRTSARMFYDVFRPSADNGDVTVQWHTKIGAVRAYGHVFTPKEMVVLFREARLNIRKSFMIDYATGQERRSRFDGSMFFILEA